MRVSIVIPTFTNHQGLKDCISSLQQFTDLDDVEIIISANGSSLETHEYIFSLRGNFKIVWNDKPLGFAKACNEGIKEAKGDYIVLLNDDVVFLSQAKNTWLDMLLAPFQNPKVGLSGDIFGYSPLMGKYIIFLIVMIKREVFDKIGLLDETFGMGWGEDVAFCVEAQKVGYDLAEAAIPAYFDTINKLIVNNFPIYHVGGATIHKIANWDETSTINQKILEKRYGKPPKVSIVIPTYTNFEGLKGCISSLEKTTDLDDVEIIISANGAPEEVKTAFKHKVIWNDNPIGYAQACNAGVKEAKGEYIILLNDDVVFIPQKKNTWLNMLFAPFQNPKVGLSGPLVSFSPPANSKFIIFFIVMIKREVFNKIGLLDEAFGMGAGEDTAFCIEAMKMGYELGCASEGEVRHIEGTNMMGGNFPVYHQGEATVHKLANWNEIFAANSKLLTDRYNK